MRHFSNVGLVLGAAPSPLGRPPGLQQTRSHPEQARGSRTSAQFQQGWGGSGFGNLANKPGFDSSLAAHWHTAFDKSLSPCLNASPRERPHPSSRDCWEALGSGLKVPPGLPGTCRRSERRSFCIPPNHDNGPQVAGVSYVPDNIPGP